MGQFLDYMAGLFTGRLGQQQPQDQQQQQAKAKSNNHVTFSEGTFVEPDESADAAMLKGSDLASKNRKVMLFYQTVSAAAFAAHFWQISLPKIRSQDFDVLQPESWQMVTLNILIPVAVYLACLVSMSEIGSQPLSDDFELTRAKNSGLDLNHNDFIHSLKVVILLMVAAQLGSLFLSDLIIWSSLMIVMFWCYQLSLKTARSEYKLYAPSLKSSSSPRRFKRYMTMLGRNKSPKKETPVKEAPQAKVIDEAQTRATPRTRTRRAVKNLITGVTDKYHTIGQNVHQQLSQNLFRPLSPKTKAIEQAHTDQSASGTDSKETK